MENTTTTAVVAGGIPRPTANSAETKPVVDRVRASNVQFDCPHCQAEVLGWMSDPRGREDECDNCGGKYSIAADARVILE